jgi:hypothetical protein
MGTLPGSVKSPASIEVPALDTESIRCRNISETY